MALVNTRRDFLRWSAVAGVGVGAAQLIGAPAALAADLDYTDPITFNRFLFAFDRSDTLGQSTDLNEWQGALAWGQSYVMNALLRMYDGTRDRWYLYLLTRHIDDVLASRDSERGVRDYRGLSLPAWRAEYPYTAGGVDLADNAGRPVLQVRSIRTPIEELLRTKPLKTAPYIMVTVSAGSQPDTFKLTVHHDSHNQTDTFDNLSMDPQSPDYVQTRIRAAWPTFNLVTVRDLRADPGSGGPPAAGSFAIRSMHLIFGVHTGMITHPIAHVARRILGTPTLRHNPWLRAKAEEYAAACEAAVGVHTSQWRENPDGEGWYDFAPGGPSGFDGTEMPANQFLALGRTQLQLAAISGDPVHADRAAKMARTFKRQLSENAENAYSWHYWLTWGLVYNGWSKADDVSAFRLSYCCARQIEDISHGHIDIDFAVDAFRDHTVFTGYDMNRFAKTFTRNVIATEDDGSPTVWSRVDGTGSTGSDAFEQLASLWMPLARWDQRIFDHVLAMYQDSTLTPDSRFFGSRLLGVANLVWYANKYNR